MAKKRNWVQIGMLLLFLVGFPVVSYFYLKSGYDYRVEAMQELKDYGRLPALPSATLWGDSLSPETHNRHIVVLHYVDLDKQENSKLFGKYMQELHEQFDGIERVRFWAGFSPAHAPSVSAFLLDYQLEDKEQYLPFDQQAIPLANIDPSILQEDKPLVFLSDTTGTIRKVYNLENGREVVRLVEHITFLMPPEKKKKAIINPEQDL